VRLSFISTDKPIIIGNKQGQSLFSAFSFSRRHTCYGLEFKVYNLRCAAASILNVTMHTVAPASSDSRFLDRMVP